MFTYMEKKYLNNKTFHQILTLGYVPRWLILIFDTILCVVAYLLAYEFSLKYYYESLISEPHSDFYAFGACIVVQVFWFFVFRTYAGIIRFSTFIDALKLLYAVVASTISIFVINFVLSALRLGGFWQITIISYAIISFLFLLMTRLVIKTLFDSLTRRTSSVVPVLIYGTKAAGVAIAQMILASTDSRYRVVGFIDNKHNTDKLILGLPIYSVDNQDKLFDVISRKRIGAIIVSPIKIKEIDTTTYLDVFINKGLNVLVMPQLDKLKDQNLTHSVNVDKNLRNIQIEDLLDRKSIVVDKEPIKRVLSGLTVLVTGAAGSIGSEIVRQLSQLNPSHIILVDNAETPLHNISLEVKDSWPDVKYSFIIADVRNRFAIERVLKAYHPQFVFHAAAYKHVPMMEAHPSECIMANVMGTKNLADLAVQYGVNSFVMVSTDKAVNPTNVMGCSKRIAEIYVQSYFKKLAKTNPDTTQFVTTRFGNVLGSNGSVIPLFKKQIAEGGPLTVTHPDIIRYFMTIPEACQLVLEAGTIGQGGNIYVFDMGTPVKIVDLAKKMIRLSGLDPDVDIKIKFTGLRPGEKLFEELLSSEEHAKSSVNDKIMVAATREYEYDDITTSIDRLIATAKSFDNDSVVRQMKAIVPEYISQNSVYSSLDN